MPKPTRTPTPPKQYNDVGVEYPLSEFFMGCLGIRLNTLAAREYHNSEEFTVFTNDQMLAGFVNDCDRDICRIGPTFFRRSHDRNSMFSFHASRMLTVDPDTQWVPTSAEFTFSNVNARRPDPTILLPRYVEQGTRRDPVGDRFMGNLWRMHDRRYEIHTEYERINMLVSTLNRICKSVGDILAQFPVLPLLVNDMTASMALQGAQPPQRPTKMPPDLKLPWRLATRTVTRIGLLNQQDPNLVYHDMWDVGFRSEVKNPDWFGRCPGYRALGGYE